MTADSVQIFTGEAEYQAAIDQVLQHAEKEIRIFDLDLVTMGLERSQRLQAISGFLRAHPGRRLKIVIHDRAALERSGPRLVELIKHFSHLIEVRQTLAETRHLSESWLLADGGHGVIRFHRDHSRGKLSLSTAKEIAPWWSRSDELWQAAEPCSPGSMTGL